MNKHQNMKRILPFFTLVFFFNSTFGQNNDNTFTEMISHCANINSGNFKSKPYIVLAVYLQSMDKNQAFLLLKKQAESFQNEDQIIVLTRMLFQAKKDSLLRRPYIGGASFFGGTDYKNWQNEPLEIVDGVPSLITRGYSLGGLPETSLSYLTYCFESGEWTSTKYSVKSNEALKSALNILLADKKWKSNLSTFDKAYFENQILN